MIHCIIWVSAGQSSWLWSQMHILAGMGFPNSCCSSPLLQCLWWLPVVPRLQEAVGKRLDTQGCPHEHLPAQLPVTLILTHCLQSPSTEVPVVSETWVKTCGWQCSAPHGLAHQPGGSRSDLCSYASASAHPAQGSERGWVIFAGELWPHYPFTCVQPWRCIPSQFLAKGPAFSGFLLLCWWEGSLLLSLTITLMLISQESLFGPFSSSSLRHQHQRQAGRRGILAPEAKTCPIVCHSDSSLIKSWV